MSYPTIIVIALLAGLAIWAFVHYCIAPANPYPKITGFTAVWNSMGKDKLSPAAKRKLKRTLQPYRQGDEPICLKVIPWKRIYSLLSAPANGTDCFKGQHPVLKRPLSFFTRRGAKRAIEEGPYHLIESQHDLTALIELLPGKDWSKQYWNFVQLMEWHLFGTIDLATGNQTVEVMNQSEVHVLIGGDGKARMIYDLKMKCAHVDYVSPHIESKAIPALVWKAY